MQIIKVSYGKTFSLGNYCSERIDLEATVDAGDTVSGVIMNLKNICDHEHKINNPHLYQEQPNYVPDTNVGNMLQQAEPQSITPKKLSQQEVLEQLINDATTMKALNWLEKPAQKYPQTKELYDFKKSQLEAVQ